MYFLKRHMAYVGVEAEISKTSKSESENVFTSTNFGRVDPLKSQIKSISSSRFELNPSSITALIYVIYLSIPRLHIDLF